MSCRKRNPTVIYCRTVKTEVTVVTFPASSVELHRGARLAVGETTKKTRRELTDGNYTTAKCDQTVPRRNVCACDFIVNVEVFIAITIQSLILLDNSTNLVTNGTMCLVGRSIDL